ncbi:PREDICTED: uncharacterized protein LOC109240108 [Nicotiana attenuata]|uniref:uncharacterized protein LOC109240108 n=1 Tax=Nicotiana attenuata TaxID=49451 RepID=UPI000904BD91|nr:PREDICTED: uncharacterized protein LOC109240108 [Nicotiana attenuata]
MSTSILECNAFIYYAAVAWMPHAFPDLEDWDQKLASTSSHAERCWRDLAKARWEAKNHDVAEMKSATPGEEADSPIPKSRKDNKRKRVSESEDPQPKRALVRRRRRNLIPVTIESVHQLGEEEEEDEGDDSALVVRARKPFEVAKPSKSEAIIETLPHDEEASKKDSSKTPESPEVEVIPLPSTSMPEGPGYETPRAEKSAPSDPFGAVTIGHSLSLPAFSEESIRDARAVQIPDIEGVPCEEDPFRDCFIEVDDAADLNDASTLFEEAQRLLSRDEELKGLRANLAQARKEEAELDEQVNILLRTYGLDSMGGKREEMERVRDLENLVEVKVKFDSTKEPEFIDSRRRFGGASGRPSLASINGLGNCTDGTLRSRLSLTS